MGESTLEDLVCPSCKMGTLKELERGHVQGVKYVCLSCTEPCSACICPNDQDEMGFATDPWCPEHGDHRRVR